MINPEIIKVIKIITSRLDKNKISWSIIGSTNLALQGMNIQPRDIDIVVKFDDLSKIRRIFLDYSPTEINELKTNTPTWNIKFVIGKVEVQILGENDLGVYVSKLINSQITRIKIKNIKVPCLDLIAEANAYSETNREQKANLIKDFLGN